MVAPAPSMAHVPLREVLPRDYLSAEAELRRFANELDSHPSAAGRTMWPWHAANSHELVDAFATGTAMLTDVLASGPFVPHPWRVHAGLPDAPEVIR